MADQQTRYHTLRTVTEADVKMIFFGPPGTAKSTTAQELLSDVCGGLDNVFSITCHDDLSAQELVGMFHPKGGEFVWVDGPALRAWRLGGGLILNEVDKASGAVWTALYSICDDKRVARLTLPTGETVKPNPRFRVIATSNQPADVLPDALRDRFALAVPFMHLTPGQIESLPEKFRPVATSAYKEEKFPQITFRKIQEFVKVVKTGDISAEEQQEVLKWAFDESANEVYNALVMTA